jgi:Domain of unknown function (DUF4352)
MSNNVCSNCSNFKPKEGDKFFNCSVATHEGVKYGMQVRADTISCDAFSPLRRPLKPQTTTKPAQKQPRPKETEPGRVMLCNWGRVLVIAAIIILIIIIAVVAYTCFSGGNVVVSPTPTPIPTPTAPPPTGIKPTPTPSPTPVPIYYFNVGDWAISPPWRIITAEAQRVTVYYQPGPVSAPAGTHFIILTVTAQNGGNSTLYTAATGFILYDSLGLKYEAIELPWNFIQAFPYALTYIDSGKTVSGRLIYNVPDVATGLELRVFVNGQYLAWVLPW